jgi:hypothetical protein
MAYYTHSNERRLISLSVADICAILSLVIYVVKLVVKSENNKQKD